jgi:hypothetical protein
MDYLYGRRWLDVSNQDKGIQLMLLEVPLVEPQNMIDERRTINQSHKKWKTSGAPTSTWFSYVMNNYWHTNYKADQEGISYYHYVLRPHGIVEGSAIEKAAYEICQPLLAFQTRTKNFNKELFELSNNKIVVTSVTPAENSYIIRLFNPEKSLQQTSLNWKASKPVNIVDMGSNKIIKDKDLILPPMAIIDFKLVY